MRTGVHLHIARGLGPANGRSTGRELERISRIFRLPSGICLSGHLAGINSNIVNSSSDLKVDFLVLC